MVSKFRQKINYHKLDYESILNPLDKQKKHDGS